MDTHKALRICEDLQFHVETSETSHVSFERVEDPLPGL